MWVAAGKELTMATLTRSTPGISISFENLTLDQIISVVRRGEKVALCSDAGFREKLQRSRQVLESKLAQGEIVYGVNTGFAGHARCLIPHSELAHHPPHLAAHLCCVVRP